ncbi:MAG: restriction endonuclease [Lachnospiraceae bacterium]|nr:restriction endonuclease [Lachnospiraceae bacterium]
MEGEEFEDFLMELLDVPGFRVELTPTSNDYGADLLLTHKGETIAIQAKRYNKSIGIHAVQEVLGAVSYYEAIRGLVITNSSFTRNAQNLAAESDVILWDGDDLINLMERRKIAPLLKQLFQ